jgi:hypothetical protein
MRHPFVGEDALQEARPEFGNGLPPSRRALEASFRGLIPAVGRTDRTGAVHAGGFATTHKWNARDHGLLLLVAIRVRHSRLH